MVVNVANLIKLGYPKYVSLIHSNTFHEGMHLYMTSILGLNRPTAFATNLLQCSGRSKNPTFKMKVSATTTNG